MVRTDWGAWLRWVAAGLVALALGGCSSTHLVTTWASPDAGEITFRKVMVVCISPHPATRRTAEDALVRYVTRAEAVPSYTLISDEDLSDEGKVQARMAEEGFDGALTMRLVSREEKHTWVQGSHPTHYNSYAGYHRGGWSGAYNPGHMRVDEVVRVETHIYSVADDTLVWTAVSETLNPTDLQKVIAEIADAAVKDLRKRGLLPPEDE